MAIPSVLGPGTGIQTIYAGELNGMPQVFLFDKTGKLVWQHKGYSPGMERVLFEEFKAL